MSDDIFDQGWEDFPDPDDFTSWDTGDEFTDDTTPEFFGFADLGEGLYAEVFNVGDDYDPSALDFTNLEDLLGTPEAEDRELAYSIMDDNIVDWDLSSEDVRGPFPDLETVIDWLNDTGLWPISTIGFDDETDDFYIEIES